MTKELIFTIQRFPSHRMKILELYEEDQDFRQLCEDYYLSIHTLDVLRKKEPEIKEAQLDYERVSKDLEMEFINYFKKNTNEPTNQF